MRKPAARKASTTPAASGTSGPTTVSATCSARANATSSATSVVATLVSSGSSAVPPLPGATKTLPTRGESAIFHASACSRPPEPMTSTFIALASLQIDLAEDIQDAAVVDGAAESWNVAGEQLRLLISQRQERQHRRERPPAGNVGPLDHERAEAEATLQARTVAQIGRPRIAEVDLGLAMRILEHEEK